MLKNKMLKNKTLETRLLKVTKELFECNKTNKKLQDILLSKPKKIKSRGKQKSDLKSVSKLLKSRGKQKSDLKSVSLKIKKIKKIKKIRNSYIDKWWDTYLSNEKKIKFETFLTQFKKYISYKKPFKTKKEGKKVLFEHSIKLQDYYVDNIKLLCLLALGFRKIIVDVIDKVNFKKFVNSFETNYKDPVYSAFQNFIFNFFDNSEPVFWYYYYYINDNSKKEMVFDHSFAVRLASENVDKDENYQIFVLMFKKTGIQEQSKFLFTIKRNKIIVNTTGENVKFKSIKKMFDAYLKDYQMQPDIISTYKMYPSLIQRSGAINVLISSAEQQSKI